MNNSKTEFVKTALILTYLCFLLPILIFDIQNNLKLWHGFGKEIIDYLTKPDFSFAYQFSLKSFLYDIMIVFPCLLIYKIENYNKIWNSFKKSKVFAVIATVLITFGLLLIALHAGLAFSQKDSHFQPEWPLIWLVLIIIPLREWIIILCSNFKKTSLSQDVNNLKLIDDQPIEHYKKLSEAKQNIYSHIKRVLAGYDETTKYLCLALNGSWGSGKTSILKAIENSNSDIDLDKEYKFSDYEILWINVWQSKSPDFAIKELESQMEEFFSKYYFNFTIDGLNFFKLLIKMYDDKVSDFFGVLSFTTSQESLKTARTNLEKSIDDCLKAANKKKILIIFDDIDRVYQQEYINAYLNLLCYVTGLKNVVSLVGVDLEKLIGKLSGCDITDNYKIRHDINPTNITDQQLINEAVEKDKKVHPEKYLLLQNDKKYIFECDLSDQPHNFTNKIFNVAIYVGDTQTSLYSSMLKQLKTNFESLKFSDKAEIHEQIKKGLDSCWGNDVFKDEREIKQIINLIQSKLDIMYMPNKLERLQDRITPWLVFVLSVIEIKHFDLFIAIKKSIKLEPNNYLISWIERHIYIYSYRSTNTLLSANGEMKYPKTAYLKDIGNTIDALVSINKKYLDSDNSFDTYQFKLNDAKFYVNPVIEPYQFVHSDFDKQYNLLVAAQAYNNFNDLFKNIVINYFKTDTYTGAYNKSSHEFTSRVLDFLDLVNMKTSNDLKFLENLFFGTTDTIIEILSNNLFHAKSNGQQILNTLFDIYTINGDYKLGGGKNLEVLEESTLFQDKNKFIENIIKLKETYISFYDRKENIIYFTIVECIIDITLSNENSEKKQKLLEIAGIGNNDYYILANQLSEKIKFISGSYGSRYGKFQKRKIKLIFFRYFETINEANLRTQWTNIVKDLYNFVYDGIEQVNIDSLTIFLQKVYSFSNIDKQIMIPCLMIVYMAIDKGIKAEYDELLAPLPDFPLLDFTKLIDIYETIVYDKEKYQWDKIDRIQNLDTTIRLTDSLSNLRNHQRHRLFFANRSLLRSGKAVLKKYSDKDYVGKSSLPTFVTKSRQKFHL